jgi:galactosyl transferase GMA12/MNN10 family
MPNRVIVTYASGAHEELLDISFPTYKAFADKHGYDLIAGQKQLDWPAAWNKIPLLLNALMKYEVAVWLDCDTVIVDNSQDFPVLPDGMLHSLVRHFDKNSEVPNSGVWILKREAIPLLNRIQDLEVFRNHGWWEQAALMTLMGYIVPPEGSEFEKTKCKCVTITKWYEWCSFMRVNWNSHPNYRAEEAKIVHCSYKNMLQRIEVMRALVKDPKFNYPRDDELPS